MIPRAPTQPLTKACTPCGEWGGEWNHHRIAVTSSQASAMPPTKAETNIKSGRNTSTSGLLLRHLRICPYPNKAVTAIEQSRCPSLNMTLSLAHPTPVWAPTKALAASTPWGMIQPMPTSDTTLPPNPLGTHNLRRDAPTKEHTL